LCLYGYAIAWIDFSNGDGRGNTLRIINRRNINWSRRVCSRIRRKNGKRSGCTIINRLIPVISFERREGYPGEAVKDICYGFFNLENGT
jgi:hypothetical protein